jgi:hypothetical protein
MRTILLLLQASYAFDQGNAFFSHFEEIDSLRSQLYIEDKIPNSDDESNEVLEEHLEFAGW